MCELIPYQADHRDGVIAVVKAAYDEYGFTWDEGGYHRDLYDIPKYYIDSGGAFWTLIDGDDIIGSVGVTLHDDTAELHRMYLMPGYRGSGLGWKMLSQAMAFARSCGSRGMQIWSDVKLPDAHKLYLRAGFIQRGDRICDDPDNSREYGFWKEL